MQGTRLRFLLRKHAVMALPKNKKCLKSEPSFGPSLPPCPTFIRSSREPCIHTSTPPVVVIQTHPAGPGSGQSELCQSSGKKTKSIHSFTFAEHSLCARHCLGNAGVTTIPVQRTRSRQRVQHGVGGGRYGESREEIWTAEGAQRGRGIKNKGPGQGSCVASQARRQEDARTMGGDPGESRESGAKVQEGGQSQDPAHDLPGLWVGARSAEGTLEGLGLFFHF